MEGWRDGRRVYHGGDSLLALFTFLQRLQEVLQDLVVSGQLRTNKQDGWFVLLEFIF